jgi:nondiscriminating glutamyl-tRNA synthetase
VDDIVRGDVHFSSNEFKDFVIRRSNGIPVYNYATVIDDALMNITHVIRAEEHLSNTPKQILIFDALKFPHPYFAHISLIFAPDRTKLSKRHGATSIGDFRRMGFLPEAMFNFLALLGWSPKDNREFFTKEELIELFTLESVNKAPAIFDISKLKWMNHKYIVELIPQEVYSLAKKIGVELNEDAGVDWWVNFINHTKEHLDTFKDIENLSNDFFEDFALSTEIIEKIKTITSITLFRQFKENISKLETWTMDSILNEIRGTGESLNIKGRNLYFPLRLAITGKEEGLEVHEFIYFLGKEKTISRLEKTMKLWQ